MSRPFAKCTVVIPCYNAEPFLEKAVASVREQALTEYHLVLVDDASTDDTRKLIQSIAAGQSNISTIELPANRGRCFARNRGSEAVDGPFVTFLDQDDTYNPAFLRDTVKALEEHSASFDAMKVLPNINAQMDPVQYEAIANSLATTTIFRRAAFHFIGGWPESQIYRDHPGGCEDIALLSFFSMCFNLGVLHAPYYNYTLRPGNALERFLKRSHVVNGQLHVMGRLEQDDAMEAEGERLRGLMRARMRQTLMQWNRGLVGLDAPLPQT
jgi:glycosyltransferase involved in cell wall biosynthesis